MALFGFELEEIARLLALVEAQGLEEFIYEEEGRYLRIRSPRAVKAPRGQMPPETRPGGMMPVEDVTFAAPPRKRRAASPLKPAESIPAANQIVLESPMMGVFYRAEKPGSPPLVNVGDRVTVGQTVGILEAMKVFSEFKAEHGGIIAAIPAPDGELVQAGAPLIVLKRE